MSRRAVSFLAGMAPKQEARKRQEAQGARGAEGATRGAEGGRGRRKKTPSGPTGPKGDSEETRAREKAAKATGASGRSPYALVRPYQLVDARVALMDVRDRSPRTRVVGGCIVIVDPDDEAAFFVAQAALSVLDVHRPDPRVVEIIREANQKLLGNKYAQGMARVCEAADDIGRGDEAAADRLIAWLAADGLVDADAWTGRRADLIALLRRYSTQPAKRGQTLSARGILARIVGKPVKLISKYIDRAR